MTELSEIEHVLSSASKLASYNMLLQLAFRLSTFVMNAITLRYISRDELGVVNVRLLLLYSTALFLSREAFRKACLSKSSNSSSPGSWKETVNLLWMVVPIGVVCCAILSMVWINMLEVPDPDKIPYYSMSTILFAMSVIIELCAEPLWIISQAFLFVKLKVVSEGVAMIVKCVATTTLVIYFPSLGILAFSLAQILYSMIYALIYFIYFSIYIGNKQTKDEFPFSKFNEVFPHFSLITSDENRKKASLVLSFFRQSVLKQFLTEGERYVMTILNVLSFSDQGVYDIVNNLGSLAPRFIFLPIEESFYIFFAKLLKRGEATVNMDKDVLSSVKNVLFCLLRLVTLLGSIFLAFGYSYSFLLLDLYGGSILSQGGGPTLLRAYCIYVLLLAINGTTECFVFAAMDQQQVDEYNKKMFAFSGLFLLASYFFTLHLGSVGFIFANCVNMGVRVAHSIYFIKNYFGAQAKFPLSGMVPERLVLLTLALSFVTCVASEHYFCCDKGLLFRFIHILVGGVCLLVVLGAISIKENVLLQFLKSQYFKKKLQ